VLANAGIDASNLEPVGEDERVLLLPRDPDGSAAAIRDRLQQSTGCQARRYHQRQPRPAPGATARSAPRSAPADFPP
jgi:hypothetical protein